MDWTAAPPKTRRQVSPLHPAGFFDPGVFGRPPPFSFEGPFHHPLYRFARFFLHHLEGLGRDVPDDVARGAEGL